MEQNDIIAQMVAREEQERMALEARLVDAVSDMSQYQINQLIDLLNGSKGDVDSKAVAYLEVNEGGNNDRAVVNHYEMSEAFYKVNKADKRTTEGKALAKREEKYGRAIQTVLRYRAGETV